jgi:hypothetical protein
MFHSKQNYDIGAFKWEILVVNEEWMNDFLTAQSKKFESENS